MYRSFNIRCSIICTVELVFRPLISLTLLDYDIPGRINMLLSSMGYTFCLLRLTIKLVAYRKVKARRTFIGEGEPTLRMLQKFICNDYE